MSIARMIKTVAASSLLVIAAISGAAAEDGVLRVGTEGDAPKFSMADPSGKVTGFDADIANGICAALKVKCVFVVQTFSSLVPSMDSDRFDVIISGLGITAEREKKIDYSIPYASFRHGRSLDAPCPNDPGLPEPAVVPDREPRPPLSLLLPALVVGRLGLLHREQDRPANGFRLLTVFVRPVLVHLRNRPAAGITALFGHA